jgi:hypothetical protein
MAYGIFWKQRFEFRRFQRLRPIYQESSEYAAFVGKSLLFAP